MLENSVFEITGAILILLLGLFVSRWIGRKVAALLDKTKLNQALKRLGVEEALIKMESKLNAPKFFGEIFKWFFYFVFSWAFFSVLGLQQFSLALERVLVYFPNIFIAAVIFIVAVFLTDFSQKIVVGTLEKEKITYSRVLGKGAALIIWILAILAMLYQLKIVPTLILTIFIGVVAIIVLILGISFGLGGKDVAAKILKDLEEKLK